MATPSSHRAERSRDVTTLLPRWLARTALLCLAALTLAVTAWLVANALFTVRTVTIAVFVALLLAALLRPVTTALTRVGTPVWVAALATVLLLLGGGATPRGPAQTLLLSC